MSRLTIRARLTLVYGGMFLLAGVALVALVYLLMRFAPRYAFPEGPAPAPEPTGSPSPIPTVAASDVLDINSKEDVLATLLLFSGVGLAVLSVLALALAWYVSGRMLARLHDITAAARTVATGNLHERIALNGPADELKELGDTFDEMLSRLDVAFQAQRRFAANASHELRTPLATTRTMLQVALADPDAHDLRVLGPKLLRTNQRSIDITNALLTLTRAEHGLTAAQPVDLARLLAEAVAGLDHGDRTVSASLSPAVIHGDPTLLRQLVTNLLANAITHNVPGGRVRVTLTRESLTVANTGPVVPPTDIELIFEPFHRLEGRRTRTGHGLGLAIVHAIAEAHHFTLTARPNPGGGLTITIHLPPIDI
ncbi:sensor histidine kinase [Nonomuraea sp. NPDC050547]|uniref:sensor histidine kinase n=1 Tax=Nonomuraea sp. NPDC050547 TaxID=3364368 RepID=UPI0037B24B4A